MFPTVLPNFHAPMPTERDSTIARVALSFALKMLSLPSSFRCRSLTHFSTCISVSEKPVLVSSRSSPASFPLGPMTIFPKVESPRSASRINIIIMSASILNDAAKLADVWMDSKNILTGSVCLPIHWLWKYGTPLFFLRALVIVDFFCSLGFSSWKWIESASSSERESLAHFSARSQMRSNSWSVNPSLFTLFFISSSSLACTFMASINSVLDGILFFHSASSLNLSTTAACRVFILDTVSAL